MKSVGRRALALILSVLMTLSLMGVASFADHEGAHEWNATKLTDNTVQIACTVEGCEYADGGTVQINAPTDLVADGTAKEATVANSLPDVFVAKYSPAKKFLYRNSAGDAVQAPVEPDTYTAVTKVFDAAGTAITGTQIKTTFTLTAPEGQCQVTFNAGYEGADPIDPVTVTSGDTVEAPEVRRDGFTLEGWYAEGSESAFDFTTPITENLALTAHWTEDTPTGHVHAWTASKEAAGDAVKLTCSNEGCDIPDGITVKIAPPTDLVADGEAKEAVIENSNPDVVNAKYSPAKKFIYRNSAGDSVQAPVDPDTYTAVTKVYDATGTLITGTQIKTTFTLTAPEGQCQVTFNAGYEGADPIDPVTVTSGDTVEAPEVRRDGFTLEGWYAEGSESAFDFTTPITENLALTAHWTEDTPTGHVHAWTASKEAAGDAVKLTCSNEGCDIPDGITVKIAPPTDLVADGEAKEAVIENSNPDVVNAKYSPVKKALYRNSAGDQVQAPVDPDTYTAVTKVFDAAGTAIAGTQIKTTFTLTAPEGQCQVTFNTDGGAPVPPAQFVEEGDYATAPTETVKKEGFTFAGWFLSEAEEPFDFANTAITENIELKARWTPVHDHSFTYGSPENGERTATCNVVGCPYNEKPAVLKVVADDLYYAGDTIDSSTAVENDPDGLFSFGKEPTYRQGETVVDNCEAPGKYNVLYRFSYNGSVIGNDFKFFTVVKATVEANEGLKQDDGKELLKTYKLTPSDAGATLVFSLKEDGDYSETVPTTDGLEAGVHTVYYKVMGKPANRSANGAPVLKTGSVPVQVGEHDHVWNVEKEGSNVANITCTVEGCQYHDEPITVTLKAEDAVYDGKKKPATIEGEIPEGVQDEIEVFWTTDVTTRVTRGSQQWDNDDGPIDAGNYKAYTRVRVNGEKTALTKEFKIAPKPVTITGLTAENKVYDGTNAATINKDNVQITGLVEGDEGKVELDAIAEGAATFADKDAGTGKAVTIDPTKITLKGDAAKNYTVDATSIGELTANIDKAPVKVEGITASNKAYDGNATATLVTTGATFGGKLDEDTLTIESIGDGEFENKNVGTGKKVTIDPATIVLGGADKDNYEVDATKSQTETTAAITALSVKVNGITASNKEYDGNRNATLVTTGATFEGLVDGDTLTIASIGNGTFSDKNVGEDKTVTIDPSTIVLGGDSAGNYSVNVDESQTETTASITARTLYIGNSIIAAVNKTYDGNTDAELRIRTDGGRPNSQIYRRIAGDDVTVVLAEGAKGSFINKNVGTGKTVNFTADVLELSGNDKGNYVIGSVGQTSTTANIRAKDLTVSGIEAKDKVYDGNRTATLVTDNIVFNGMVEGDDLTLTFNDNAGEFDTRHVGKDKTVTIVWRRYQQNRYTLSGADVGNYNFSRQNSQQTTTASISPAKIKVTAGVGADDKVYDGNTDATLKVVEPVTFDALLNDQDVVSIEVSGIGEFDDKNVGEGKTVTFDPSQITLTGPQAGNYEFDEEGSQSETTASITRKPIKVTGITAKDRYYDGTTDAELLTTGANIEGKVFGDEIFVESASNGKFLDKKAGNGKTVNIDPAGVVLGGTDKDNYSVNPESIQKTTTASIWKLPVEIEWYKEATDPDTAEEPIKYVYNGEKQGPVAKVKNIIEGDEVDVKVIGQEKNASEDPYTAEATQLTGDDAGNYTLSPGAKQQFYIDPKPVTVVWTDKTSLVYDGKDKQPDCVVNPSQIIGEDKVVVVGVDVTKDGEEIEWGDWMIDAATYEFEVTELSNSNYVLKKDDPSLTHTTVVEQRVAELSWDPTEFTYNGDYQIPTATVANLVTRDDSWRKDTCDVTVEGAEVNAGLNYTAEAKAPLSNKNYKLPVPATQKFSIAKAPLEVTAEDKSKVYGKIDPELTYTYKPTPLFFNKETEKQDEFTGELKRAEGEDVGTYDIEQGTLSAGDNYEITFNKGTLTITKAELTAKAADQTIYYGEDFDKTKVVYDGFKFSDDESVVTPAIEVSSDYYKNAKPGTYKLTPSGGEDTKNYNIKFVDGKLTVKKKITTLLARVQSTSKKKARFTWNKVTGAVSYDVYFTKCGVKNKYKKIATVKTNTYKKKGLKKSKCYKYYVVAKDAQGKKIATSNVAHFVSGDIVRNTTNARSLKVNRKAVTLAVGKTFKIKAKQKKVLSVRHLLSKGHEVLLRYRSSNPAIATVSAKGKITAKSKGYCEIYVQSVNGIWKTVKVTVK